MIGTKIKINCCNCVKSTGCEIKKKYRELTKTIEPMKSDYRDQYIDTIFKLTCPFYDNKYNHINELNIKFGVGRYEEDYIWESDCCPSDGSCSGCQYYCDENDFSPWCEGNGIVHDKRVRVSEYIETAVRVLGGNKSKIYVAITLDANLLNDFDKQHLSVFSKKIYDCNYANSGYYPYYEFIEAEGKITFKTVIRRSQIIKKLST